MKNKFLDYTKEVLVISAIKCQNGKVYLGRRHNNCFSSMIEKNEHINSIQGFLTNKDRFVDRKEGEEIARESNQLEGKLIGSVLSSEDLW